MDITELGRYLKTKNDAADLQGKLEQIADSLYRTDTSAIETMRMTLPYQQAIVINKFATQAGVNLDDKVAIQTFLMKLRDAINALPVVQITLAARPSANLVMIMHDWFYRTYKKTVILDILINPDIVAGSIISANGKYYDATLRKKTEQFFTVTN